MSGPYSPAGQLALIERTQIEPKPATLNWLHFKYLPKIGWRALVQPQLDQIIRFTVQRLNPRYLQRLFEPFEVEQFVQSIGFMMCQSSQGHSMLVLRRESDQRTYALSAATHHIPGVAFDLAVARAFRQHCGVVWSLEHGFCSADVGIRPRLKLLGDGVAKLWWGEGQEVYLLRGPAVVIPPPQAEPLAAHP